MITRGSDWVNISVHQRTRVQPLVPRRIDLLPRSATSHSAVAQLQEVGKSTVQQEL